MTNVQEIWLPIKGYESRYKISNFGRVINKMGKLRIIGKNKNGYSMVNLSKPNCKLKRASIHRLVATHFIVNPENKKQVNHIDGNKENNNYVNLEWVSDRENKNHALDNNLYPAGYRHKSSKIQKSELSVIFELRFKGSTFKQIAEKFCVHETCISRIINNKSYKQ